MFRIINSYYKEEKEEVSIEENDKNKDEITFVSNPPYISLSDEEIEEAVKSIFPYHVFEKGPREYQIEYIIKTIKAYKKYRYVIINAPTGSGKSCIAFAVASFMNKYSKGKLIDKSFINVPFKTLQDQYCNDFTEMEFMKGVDNYKCIHCNTKCSMGPCRMPSFNLDILKAHINTCLYTAAKNRAKACPYTLFNTASFLTFLNRTLTFKPRRFLVVDEAHTLENNLRNFITFNFNSDKLFKLGIKDIPKYTLPSQYREWLLDLQETCERIYNQLTKKVDSIKEKTQIKDITKLLSDGEVKLLLLAIRYYDRATLFINYKEPDNNFVILYSQLAKSKSIEFKPIMVDKFAHKYMFRFAECFLFLSATIYKSSFCRELGLKEDEVEYLEIPSTFLNPKKRRPFIVDNKLGYLNYKNIKDKLPIMLDRIEEIANQYSKYKGLICTHTYNITEFIIKNSSNSLNNRLISHKGGMTGFGLTREEALQKHCISKDPTILISPNMYEGIDLKDDLARWCYICKVPYSSLADPQVKRKMEIDNDWYQWQTIMKIIQAYGRIVRSKKDWGFTIMGDYAFYKIYFRYNYMFPKWFKEAVIFKSYNGD